MRVLDRYVLRGLLPAFAVGVGLFTFILVVDRIYSLTELIVTKGVPFYLVFKLLVYMLPSFLVYTLPMALLTAVLLVAGRMASDLEVVAFEASGVSSLRLFAPFAAAAMLVTGVTAVLTLGVMPFSNAAFHQQVVGILRSRASAGVEERVFNTTFDGFVMYVEEVTASQVGLRGILLADERDPRLSRVITAERGRLFSDSENGRSTLRLLDGTVHETDTDWPARYRSIAFRLYDIALPVGNLPPRVNGAEEDLGFHRLLAATVMRSRAGPNVVPFSLDLPKRVTLPLAAIVFAMVGFPLGVRARRGAKGIALIGSLTIAVTYYVLMAFLDGMANVQSLAPSVAAWTPTLLFGSFGLGLLSSVAQIPARTMTRWRPSLDGSPRRSAFGPPISRKRPPAVWGRWRSRHVIDRYLVGEFLAYLAYGVGIAVALFLAVDLLLTLHLHLRLQPPLLHIIEHILYRLPAALYEGFPIIVLVSTVLLFQRLSSQHELTALQVAGKSLYRVSLPILLSAVGLSLASMAFQETLLPILEAKGDQADQRILRPGRHAPQLHAPRWFRSAASGFVRADLLAAAAQQMSGVSVLEVDRDFHLRARLDAVRARGTAGGWELERGIARQFGPEGSPREVPLGKMVRLLPDSLIKSVRFPPSPETMSFRELRTYLSNLQADGHQVARHLVQLYSKLAFPLIHVIMVLVAIPLALWWPCGGRISSIALASAIAVGYWAVNSMAIAFAKADILPPALAAWTANVVFTGVGVSLFLRRSG